MVEKARGAEARAILGDIRKLAIAYRLAYGSINGIPNSAVNIGPEADQIPYKNSCRSTHYFGYTVFDASDPIIGVDATRCTSGGKAPQGSTAGTLALTTNLSTGEDIWGGTGGY